MALQYVVAGVLSIAIVLCVFLFAPSLRNLEDRLPDHEQMETVDSIDTG